MFSTMILVCLTGILIHELCHIAVLSWYGYRIQALYIGLPMKPFIKISLGKFINELYLTPYFWSGMTVPIMEQKPVASKWFLINLAGPLGNLLILLLIYLLKGPSEFIDTVTFFTNGIHPAGQPGFWTIAIAMNIAFGLGELIPYVAKDGTEILNVITGKHTRELNAVRSSNI